MKVLIVGSGGREHALVEKAHHSRHRPEVLCAPGNAGTEQLARNVSVAADDLEGLTVMAQAEQVDLTIVGPEAPLCGGIVDRFQACGLRIFGPTAQAARIEGDKAYAKELLRESRIPTASGRSFTRFRDAKSYIATRDTPQVVKAAGLAGGKGVVVCDDPSDALIEAEKMLVFRSCGEAGKCIVVEEKLSGTELSVHALVDGRNIYILDCSKDHKRLGSGDTGPNTGGMGAFCPVTTVSPATMSAVESEILVPIVDTLRRRDITYTGVLYCGLMLTPSGPKVLEFNCRFGDPEAQVLLPRLRADLVDLANACIDGTLDTCEIEWDPRSAVCVVAVSDGYPDAFEAGKTISGLSEASATPNVSIYQAGTSATDSGIITNGGRVLGVTALADGLPDAQRLAYETIRKISFDGIRYRDDIAQGAISDTQ